MIYTPEYLKSLEAYRPWYSELVWTNGYFDILHVGHIRGLREASEQGTLLIVGVNAQTTKRGKPLVNSLEDRMEALDALRYVDVIVPFYEETPVESICSLRPDICCKGAEYEGLPIPEKPLVESWGGRMHFLTQHAGYSTSGLISRARQ